MLRCQSQGTTATATLTQFIKLYLNGSLDNLLALPDNALDSRLSEKVKVYVDNYLVECLPFYIDRYLINSQVHLTETRRKQTESTTAKKEREFWFIKERASYLGLEINANQIIHIELWANEAYKERHGKLPGRQLFRRTQAFAYPKSDVDILDRAIRGVLARG